MQREVTPPVILPASQLLISQNSFTLDSDNFWNGDAIKVFGLNAQSLVEIRNGFIARDQTGKGSIYLTEAAAINRDSNAVVSLSGLTSSYLLLAHDTNAAHALYLKTYLNRYAYDQSLNVLREFDLSEDVESYSFYQSIGPAFLDWKIQATIRNWSLNISTPVLDSTGLDESYFDGVKSVLSGSGTFDFLIDFYAQPGLDDSYAILKLAMMLENGARGNTRFYLSPDKDADSVRRNSRGGATQNRKVYYSCKILLSNTSVDTSADALIVGSADFLSVGPVSLGVDVLTPVPDDFTIQDTPLGAFYFSNGSNDTTSTNIAPTSVIDSSDNYFVANRYSVNGSGLGLSLSRFSRSNLNWPNWTKLITTNDDYTYPAGAYIPRLDKQGNLWVGFVKLGGTAGKYKFVFAKISKSTGEVLASICVTVPTTSITTLGDSALVDFDFDNAGNIYLGLNIVQIRSGFGGITHTSRHACVVKVSNDGFPVWTRYLLKTGGNSSNRAVSGASNLLRIIVRGNEVIVGARTARSTAAFADYTTPASFWKLNLNGVTLYELAAFGAQTSIDSVNVNDISILAFDVAPDGSIYAIYTVSGGSNNSLSRIHVIKISAELEPVWAYAYNHIPDDISIGANNSLTSASLTAKSVHIDPDGRIFLLASYANVNSSEIRPCLNLANPSSLTSDVAVIGAGVSEIDTQGNYISLRYYNPNSQNPTNLTTGFGPRLYSIGYGLPVFSGGYSPNYLPIAAKTNSSQIFGTTSSASPRDAQTHVFAKRDGQFGAWGQPCESRFGGDFSMTVYGYPPSRSSLLNYEKRPVQNTDWGMEIVDQGIGMEPDSSYAISENLTLNTPVTGFAVGD